MRTYLFIYFLLCEQALRFLHLQPAEIRERPAIFCRINADSDPRRRAPKGPRRRSSETTFSCFSLVFATSTPPPSRPGLCGCVVLEQGLSGGGGGGITGGSSPD